MCGIVMTCEDVPIFYRFTVCLDIFPYFSHFTAAVALKLFFTSQRSGGSASSDDLALSDTGVNGLVLTYADGQQPTVTIGNQHLNHLTASSLRRTPLREST